MTASWTQETLPSTQQWFNVAYGNGLFIALVNESPSAPYTTNIYATSPDGVTWTQRTFPVTQMWQAIAYGAGIFVVTPYDITTIYLTSTDGLTWTSRSTSGTAAPSGHVISFANNIFIAGTNSSSYICTSPDGVTWTNQLASRSNINAVAYGNGVYVGVGSGTSAATSTNGTTWTNQTLPVSGGGWSIAFGAGVFVIVSLGTASYTLSSTNGTSWTQNTLPYSTYFQWSGLCFGSVGGISQFMAVEYSGHAANSTDGINWTGVTYPVIYNYCNAYGNNSFVSLGYNSNASAVYNSPTSSLSVTTVTRKPHTSLASLVWAQQVLPVSAKWGPITFGNGIFLTLNRNSSTTALTSTNGITWTQQTLPLTQNYWAVTYAGGLFVAVATSSTTAITSPDGVTWTEVTLPVSTSWQSITYGNGTFVAVSASSAIATSTNGSTWTQVTLSSTGWATCIYANNLFVLLDGANSQEIATSANGSSWSYSTTALPAAAYWSSVAYGNGIFVAVAGDNGSVSATAIAATSTNGTTWTSATLPVSAYWTSVTFGNGYFVAVAYSSTSAAVSTNGTSWTLIPLPVSAGWNGVAYGNNTFVAVAGGSATVIAATYTPPTPLSVTVTTRKPVTAVSANFVDLETLSAFTRKPATIIACVIPPDTVSITATTRKMLCSVAELQTDNLILTSSSRKPNCNASLTNTSNANVTTLLRKAISVITVSNVNHSTLTATTRKPVTNTTFGETAYIQTVTRRSLTNLVTSNPITVNSVLRKSTDDIELIQNLLVAITSSVRRPITVFAAGNPSALQGVSRKVNTTANIVSTDVEFIASLSRHVQSVIGANVIDPVVLYATTQRITSSVALAQTPNIVTATLRKPIALVNVSEIITASIVSFDRKVIAASYGFFPSSILNSYTRKPISQVALTITGGALLSSLRRPTSSIIVTATGGLIVVSTSNIHYNLAAWVATNSYVIGNRISSNNNAYQCSVAGTSGNVSPTGSGTFTDGTIIWTYLSSIDFTSIQSWASSLPATLSNPVVGLLWNNGTILGAGQLLYLQNIVTSTINTITLTCAPGESFRDTLKANPNLPLGFNTVNGVSFTLTSTGSAGYFLIAVSNVIVNGIQFLDTAATGSTSLFNLGSNQTCVFRNCIINGYAKYYAYMWSLNPNTSLLLDNCIVIDNQSTTNGAYMVKGYNATSTINVHNCDIIAAVNAYGTAMAFTAATVVSLGPPTYGFTETFGTINLVNTIFSGYKNVALIASSATATNCSFSTASIPSYITPTNCLFSQSLSLNVNDLRVRNVTITNGGIIDQTSNPYNDDIIGTHRPQGSSWDIGAWELFNPPIIITSVTRKTINTISLGLLDQTTIGSTTRKSIALIQCGIIVPCVIHATTRKVTSVLSTTVLIIINTVLRKPIDQINITEVNSGSISVGLRRANTVITTTEVDLINYAIATKKPLVQITSQSTDYIVLRSVTRKPITLIASGFNIVVGATTRKPITNQQLLFVDFVNVIGKDRKPTSLSYGNVIDQTSIAASDRRPNTNFNALLTTTIILQTSTRKVGISVSFANNETIHSVNRKPISQLSCSNNLQIVTATRKPIALVQYGIGITFTSATRKPTASIACNYVNVSVLAGSTRKPICNSMLTVSFRITFGPVTKKVTSDAVINLVDYGFI